MDKDQQDKDKEPDGAADDLADRGEVVIVATNLDQAPEESVSVRHVEQLPLISGGFPVIIRAVRSVGRG